MISSIFCLALSRFLGNMTESRCMASVLTPITGEVEVSPAEDMLDNSPPVKKNNLDIKNATFLVSLVYYLLLLLL